MNVYLWKNILFALSQNMFFELLIGHNVKKLWVCIFHYSEWILDSFEIKLLTRKLIGLFCYNVDKSLLSVWIPADAHNSK